MHDWIVVDVEGEEAIGPFSDERVAKEYAAIRSNPGGTVFIHLPVETPDPHILREAEQKP